MLDRLPTELILLIIDATSTSAWERKALIDSLSSVSKNYRFAMQPLRESIVHIPKASVIPLLRSWPAATRKAVDTVFVGSGDQADALEPFSIRDYSRLLAILPKIKHIYLRQVEDSIYSGYSKEMRSMAMWFELNPSNPFRRASTLLELRKKRTCTDKLRKADCLSLSILQAQWHFPSTLETAPSSYVDYDLRSS